MLLSEVVLGVLIAVSCWEQSRDLQRGIKVWVSRERGEEERVWLDDLMPLVSQEMLSCGLPKQC